MRRYVTLAFPTPQGMQTLLSAEQIQERVRGLAQEIRADHPDGVHFVCVLKGAFVFLSDMSRAMEGEVTLDFMAYLQDILKARSPRSLRTACLLSKPSRRKVEVKVEYIGFTIEDKFVVGYGLDYAERYRHLPYIGLVTS